MAPSKYMAFMQYEDVRGVIGTVGSAIADAGVNIAAMQVGRTEAGGTALMGINLDSPISRDLLDRIVAEVGADEAWGVEL
jgi:D-3-phosphoglycerate dehydrogenase